VILRDLYTFKMNKKCAKCGKTVYPTEELKALDKVWHKFCFKCDTCGMTLNMKNYKGYEKIPYCNAHYPTSKPTAVADTPESRRIAQNTKVQSNIQYHKDFEQQKGTKTSVADDPETQRVKANTQIQSNVNYWGIKEQRDNMEGKRPNEDVDDVRGRGRNPGKISDYDPAPQQQKQHMGASMPIRADAGPETDFASPYSSRNSATVVYDSSRGGQGHRTPHQAAPQPVAQPAYTPQPQLPPQQMAPPPARAAQPPPPQQPKYVAVYDYTAADDDEVSFNEGDVIMNAEKVDEGWMTGTVQRSGQHGMLPSNYVEQC